MKSTLFFLFLFMGSITVPNYGYVFYSSVDGDNDTNMIGQPAPNFDLLDLDGERINLNSYKSKYLVIHIATTWCPFCNAEAPYLVKLSQEYKTRNVNVLIIDVKEPKELVQSKLKEKHNISFPILLDPDGKVAASYAPPDVLPDLARDEVMLASNLLIDPDGKIQFMSLLDSKNFDAKLVELKKRLDALLDAD